MCGNNPHRVQTIVLWFPKVVATLQPWAEISERLRRIPSKIQTDALLAVFAEIRGQTVPAILGFENYLDDFANGAVAAGELRYVIGRLTRFERRIGNGDA